MILGGSKLVSKSTYYRAVKRIVDGDFLSSGSDPSDSDEGSHHVGASLQGVKRRKIIKTQRAASENVSGKSNTESPVSSLSPVSDSQRDAVISFTKRRDSPDKSDSSGDSADHCIDSDSSDCLSAVQSGGWDSDESTERCITSENSSASSSGSSSGNESCEFDVSFPSGSLARGPSDQINFKSPADFLQWWSVKCCIPNSSLSALLSGLQPFIPSLPKDHRTLLGMCSTVVTGVEAMAGGEYYYFGLKEVLREIIEIDMPSGNLLHLIFNVDGLRLYNNSSNELWPILCKLDNCNVPPIPVQVWFGKGKAPVESFFKDFVPELKELLQNGFSYGGINFCVRVKYFVCDSPAVAYIKSIKYHNGEYGCGKCVQRGIHHGRMTFPKIGCLLRTDQSFVSKSQRKHHTGTSPLVDLGIGMISCFPLDYMHLVCLGATKRLLVWLLKGERKIKRKVISANNAELMSQRLERLRVWWPRDFSRKPRSLEYVEKYKATEFRQILLYSGPVVFKNLLPRKYYEHFLKLHAAITILCREDLHLSLNDIAAGMLTLFITDSLDLFSKEFVVYNIHNLEHLANDCKLFGKLDNFSAFSFENELGVLKRLVHGRSKPIPEIVNRIQQRSMSDGLWARRKEVGDDGVVLASALKHDLKSAPDIREYCKLNLKGRTISLLKGDNGILLVNQSAVLVHKFVREGEETYVVGQRFEKYTDLYLKPIPSSELGIYQAYNLSPIRKKWPLSMVQCKAVILPLKNRGNFAVFPLIN